MKKTAFSRRLLAVLLVAAMCLAVIPAMVFAEELPTFDASAKNYENAQPVESADIADGVTVVFDIGTNPSNAPKYYDSGTAIRCYSGNTFTVASTKGNITKIVLGFGSGDKDNAIAASSGTYTESDGTWIGDASSVTFTIDGTSGHRRIQKITVTVANGTVDPGPVDPVDPPVDPVDPKATTIADALKVEPGKNVENVTGVVTFIETGTSSKTGDWTNVYIQDAEGKNGICIRVTDAKLANKVGDVLTVESGKRANYNGLPQLETTEAKVTTSSEKIELKVNEVTIDKLTEAMICTYVHITDLEVTIVDDGDGKYANPNVEVKDKNGKTIQIYKAILGETEVKVGDKLDFTGAVGFFIKTDKETGEETRTLQLRNTLATEIKVTSGTTVDPEPTEPKPTEPKPTEKPEETKGDTYVLGTEVKDGDKIILVNAANNKALSTALNKDGYPAGVNVTPNSSKITTANADIVWTVKVVDGGLQLVNAKGETLSCKSGLKYGAEGNVWVFEFDGKTLKVKSATETGKSGDPKYLEWYADKGNFSTYYLNNSKGEPNDPALFAMNVYVLDPDATPVAPSGNPGTADNAQLVLAGVVMVMAVAAAAAVVTQRKKSF